MVIVGLLAIALACLVTGLVLPNAAWLVGSLIATAGAGYLLWRARRTVSTPAAGVDDAEADSDGESEALAGADLDSDTDPSAAATDDTRDSGDTHDNDDTTKIAAIHDTPVISTVVDPSIHEGTRDTAREPVPVVVVEVAHVALASDRDVWVIDGRPRYHLETCAIIKGQDAEPIPWDQATGDGFMPCSLCEPDSVLAS